MTQEEQLPSDLADCHALIVTQRQELASLQEQITAQQLLINELLREAYEKHSERYLASPSKLEQDFQHTPEAADAAQGLAEAIDESADASTTEVPATTESHEPVPATRRPRRRRPPQELFPEHIERYEVKVAIADELKHCSEHGERKLIDYDRQETLERVPAKLRLRITLFPKYACPGCPECGVVSPPRPEGLVEGNRYDTSIAAEIIGCKYGFHLPIYRQQDWFAGSGWTPSRGTMLHIAQKSGDLLPPFIEYLCAEARASGVLGTDDTPVTLILPPEHRLPAPNPDDPQSRRICSVFAEARAAGKVSVPARMWAYRCLTRKLNVFDFTVSRHRDGPDQFLIDQDFRGTLLADCYTGYQSIELRSDDRVVHAACNAHARRKVFEARDNHPALAAQLLSIYQKLYDLEDRAREMNPDERLTLRSTEARSVWSEFQMIVEGDLARRVLPKEKMAEALGYLRNHWSALQKYLDDGRLPIDNNETEQLMKQVAIGRKNWLFIGSVDAGRRAANFLTLVSSAVRNDLDANTYLKAVLDALLTGSTDYASLAPERWAQEHPEAIRVYRREERSQRRDAQRDRRQKRRQLTAKRKPN